MKRYGNLYEKIVSADNISLALYNASTGKMKYDEVKEVFRDEQKHLNKIEVMLKEKTYECGEYSHFVKKDKGKDRVISKLPFFPDRVVQHAILQITEPIWKSVLINHTFQSIKGRGVHTCLKKVVKTVQVDKVAYCLQVDVKKFYPSISTKLLRGVIRKKIKCKDTLWLLDRIIDGSEGVPIGNYISQYFGNLYLSEVDHYIKEVFRVKNYYRYCDDLLIFSNDKAQLWDILKYINSKFDLFHLSVKENYQVFEVSKSRGVGCLGYTVYPHKVKIRRRIINNFQEKINEMMCSSINMGTLGSYYGWFKHCDSLGLWEKMTKPLLTIASEKEYLGIMKLTLKLKRGVLNV